MALPEQLSLSPFTRPCRGEVSLPGSKSLTNRALLLAALCDAPVELTGALFSEDTLLMAEALRQLGCSVSADAGAATVTVSQQSELFQRKEPVDVFVGLAGTAARFLTALCAAAPRGTYRLDGVPQMRKRPMRGLIDALRKLGARIHCTGEEGFFPLVIEAQGLRGGPVAIDASESSQMLSALLMVAPLAATPVDVTLVGDVRWPFVEMTARLMKQFGGPSLVRFTSNRFVIGGNSRYRPSQNPYPIEPDATAASYFLALPFVAGGSLQLRGLNLSDGLQGDTAFATVLQRAGLTLEQTDRGLVASYITGTARTATETSFREFSDTFLTLAAIAPLLTGTTRITGIAHTRKQETDRVAGMARELQRLGQEVVETEDTLEIQPQPLRSGQVIETYGDHRFAMSFGVLGCYDLHGNGNPWLTVRNPACCAKTFPSFFEVLEQVRTNSLSA